MENAICEREPEAALPEQVNYGNKPIDPYFASFFSLARRVFGFTFQGADNRYFNDPTISGQLIVKRSAAELTEEDSPEAYKQGVKDPKEINANHKLKRVPLTVIERFPPCDIPGHIQVFLFTALTIEAFLSALNFIPAFARDQQILEMHLGFAILMRYIGRSLIHSNEPVDGKYPSSWSEACRNVGRNIITWADATFSKAHIETRWQPINTSSDELDEGIAKYVETLYGFDVKKEPLLLQKQTDSQTYVETLCLKTKFALQNIDGLIGMMKANDVPMFCQKYFHIPHPKSLDLDTPLRIADAGARITMWMGGAQWAGYSYIMLFREMRNIEYELADRSIGLNQRTQLLEQISLIKEEERSPYYKQLQKLAQHLNKELLDPDKNLQDIIEWDAMRVETQLAFSALRYTEKEFEKILERKDWFEFLVSEANKAHKKLAEESRISQDKNILRARLRAKIASKK